MANHTTFDHRHTPHRSIVMPAERAEQIRRVSVLLGISGETLIQRFIDLGLAVFDGSANDAR